MSTGANLDYLRGANDAAVLARARGGQSVTRHDLARALGMTPQAISKILARLIDRGLVGETGTVIRGPGKPTTLYRLLPESRRAIGVQVSRSTLRAVVADLAGEPIDVRTVDFSSDTDAAALTATITDAAQSLRDVGPGHLVGVGVGMPGAVDPGEGYFRGAGPADPWRDLPLRATLTARLGLPILVDNDSTAAVVAEGWSDPEGTEDAALMLVEDGIGVGLRLGGTTHRGVHGDAGEIGHTVCIIGGVACICGRHGCAQSEHAAAWDRGDGEQAARILSAALIDLLKVTDVRRVILSGRAFFARQELYLESVHKALRIENERHPWRRVELTTSTRGNEVIALGAAAEVLENEYGTPMPLSEPD